MASDAFLEGLDYPSTSEKLERNIGSFFIAWGVLERELDTAFPVLFHTDPTLACCLYANLGTRAKLDTLKSAISMLASALGGNLITRAHGILNVVGDLNDVARNTLAHGQVQPFFDESTSVLGWELVRQVARKSHKMVIHPGSPRYWGRRKREVVAIATRWRKCVAAIYRKMKALTLDDLDEICTTRLEEFAQEPLRPRKSQLQSKPQSPDRRAKRARWPRPAKGE